MIPEQIPEQTQSQQPADGSRAVRWTRDEIAAWCAAHGRRLALFLDPAPPLNPPPPRFPASLSRPRA
jgi:hypothetical protein